MPRKKLVESCEYPYHITNRSNNREFFSTPLPLLWKIIIDKVFYLDHHFNIKSHAFVLMSNHYHWILSTPNENLSRGMTYFHREVARCANREVGRINHFFGGRYKWCSIQNERYYWNAVKYVFRNPVKANLCSKVEDYRYSSLKKGSEDTRFRMNDFFNNSQRSIELDLDWLNEAFNPDMNESLKKALRRRTFQLPKDRNRKTVNLVAAQYKKGLGTF